MAENDVAAPVSGEARKPRKGIGAVLDRKDDEIAALKAELEKERAAKAAPAQPITVGSTEPIPVIEAANVPAAPPSSVPQGYDIARDPLGWIDENVDCVHLVSQTRVFPGWVIPLARKEDYREAAPYLHADADRPWRACPFAFKGKTQEDTKNLRLMKEKFWHLKVERFYADRVFMSRHSPLPTRAIIEPESFVGLDARGQPEGRKSPCSTDTLRELIRYYLQAFAGDCWLDYHAHPGHVEFYRPNPYGAKFDSFGMVDPKTVRTANAEGDIR